MSRSVGSDRDFAGGRAKGVILQPVTSPTAPTSPQVGDLWFDTGTPALPSALTTKGDLLGYDGTALARVPAGADGTQLVAGSGETLGLRWDKPDLFTAPGPTGAKAETFHRGQPTTTLSLTSGTMQAVLMWAVKGVPITSVTWQSGATGAGTPTHQWAALYSLDLQTMFRQSADGTNAAWAGSTPKTFTFTSPYTPTITGPMYFMMMITATTVPNLIALNSNGILLALAPNLAGTSTTGLASGTAPSTAAALSSGSQLLPYVYWS